MEPRSVTVWLRQFAQGDHDAARNLWDRYGPTLLELARRRFPATFTATGDANDLVQSVFRVLWVGARRGRFDGIRDREELWWLLLKITQRKAYNRRAYNRRKKRAQVTVPLDRLEEGNGRSSPRSSLPADPEQPPPDLILMLDEEQQRLLSLLRDDILRSIALWKLEGYTHKEIAKKLNVAPRTIIRKINLIRERWAEELGE